MNSDTMELAKECLVEAGAITLCSLCQNAYVDAYDDDAVHQAYGRAENLRKAGERGFRGMTRQEVVAAIKSELDDTPSKCPNCHSA